MCKDSVLIIDSDKNTLAVLAELFIKKGFNRSMGVVTGEDIAAVIEDKKPDIVLLNIDIKGENAVDILLRIKAHNLSLPVIILARPDLRHMAEAAIKKGASAYIVHTGMELDIVQSLKDQLNIHRRKVSGKNCDILIIDDDTDILNMVKEYLRSSGYVCQTVSESARAIDVLSNTKPKLVLLDIVMPGTDGMNILNLIKKTNPKTKVIMMSGISDYDICINAVKSGASGYITKPFSLQQLKVTIATTLFE
jgi:DNA-binding NtrC family response regulator